MIQGALWSKGTIIYIGRPRTSIAPTNLDVVGEHDGLCVAGDVVVGEDEVGANWNQIVILLSKVSYSCVGQNFLILCSS